MKNENQKCHFGQKHEIFKIFGFSKFSKKYENFEDFEIFENLKIFGKIKILTFLAKMTFLIFIFQNDPEKILVNGFWNSKKNNLSQLGRKCQK